MPIIATSASTSAAHQAQSLARGANEFLPKPIDLNQLLDTVGRLLDLRWCSAASRN